MTNTRHAGATTTSARLPIAVFTTEYGGRFGPGRYDFTFLHQAFADVETAPVLIGYAEAKEYELWGEEFGLAAADELSRILHRPYDMRLLPVKGKKMPTMVLFDPTVLALRFWGKKAKTVEPSKKGSLKLRVRGTNTCFGVHVDQRAHYDGAKRWSRAKQLDHWGGNELPMLMMGDFNGTASGLHLPQRNWNEAPRHKVHHKGIQLPDGTWGPDCRAMDHLLGEWIGRPDDPRPGILRAPGTRFVALAEIAHFEQGMSAARAFCPTVNNAIDNGGALLIDWILLNDAWRVCGGDLVPGTYRVHVPDGTCRADYPSDHRLVTATVELAVELAVEDEWAMASNSALSWELAA